MAYLQRVGGLGKDRGQWPPQTILQKQIVNKKIANCLLSFLLEGRTVVLKMGEDWGEGKILIVCFFLSLPNCERHSNENKLNE